MTVKEFQSKLNKLINDYPEIAGKRIVIGTNDNTLGTIANTDVEEICVGIDWNSNMVVLLGKDKIYKEKETITQDEILKIGKDSKVRKCHECPICKISVNKNDKFCKKCGREFVK